MGGILIIGSVFIRRSCGHGPNNLYLGLPSSNDSVRGVGFADDWIKYVKKRSLALRETKDRRAMITALLVWGVLWAWGDYPWNVSVPFFKATAIAVRAQASVVGPLIYFFYSIYSFGFVERR